MLLTDEQIAIFSRWLELQISTSEGIQQQFEKMRMHEALLKKERAEQMACKIVLRMVTSGESMTLSGS